MEFLAGVLVTLFVEFIGYEVYKSRERKKARTAYIPPAPKPRPVPRDYSDRNEP